MQRSGYFLISGALSLGIYLLICFSFLIYINSSEPKKYDSSKTTVLELELISTKSEKKTIARKTENKLQEEIVKVSTSKSQKQKSVDAKSLFANVTTKAKKVVKKETNTVNESIDPSRFKSKFQKQKKTDNSSISKLLSDTKTTSENFKQSSPTTGEEHEYFSKIKELLSRRWNPKLLDKGLLIKVLVTITNDGKFDYRIMKYSKDERFDEQLKEFLESQKYEIFPTHKINKEVGIITNFKSEG